MDPYSLEPLKRKFVSVLFELTGGDATHYRDSYQIGEGLGLSREDTASLVRLLAQEGLLRYFGTGGGVRVTQDGNRLAIEEEKERCRKLVIAIYQAEKRREELTYDRAAEVLDLTRDEVNRLARHLDQNHYLVEDSPLQTFELSGKGREFAEKLLGLSPPSPPPQPQGVTNTLNFFGAASGNVIQQAGAHSNQELRTENVQAVLDAIKPLIESLAVDASAKEEITEDIQSIEVQLKKATPRWTVIRGYLGSIVEKVGVGTSAAFILDQVKGLLGP